MKSRLFMVILLGGFFLISVLSFPGFTQNPNISWKRSSPETQPDLQLFHSPHSIDLPTATTLQKWDVEFEISHRFIPPTSVGINGFYGLDGPVNMRIALGLALNNRSIITLGRSNFNDNIDLTLKYKIFEIRNNTLPVIIAARAGGAWNSNPAYIQIIGRDKTNSRNFQTFGQVILNTMIRKKFGIGIVPSYLYNTDIRFEDKTKDTFRLGLNAQYYVGQFWSVLIEYTPYVSGYRSLVDQRHNPLSFGIELETGGHFFKIFLSNSKFLNSTQFLAGADLPVENNDWRLGFMITRLLKFGKKI